MQRKTCFISNATDQNCKTEKCNQAAEEFIQASEAFQLGLEKAFAVIRFRKSTSSVETPQSKHDFVWHHPPRQWRWSCMSALVDVRQIPSTSRLRPAIGNARIA